MNSENSLFAQQYKKHDSCGVHISKMIDSFEKVYWKHLNSVRGYQFETKLEDDIWSTEAHFTCKHIHDVEFLIKKHFIKAGLSEDLHNKCLELIETIKNATKEGEAPTPLHIDEMVKIKLFVCDVFDYAVSCFRHTPPSDDDNDEVKVFNILDLEHTRKLEKEMKERLEIQKEKTRRSIIKREDGTLVLDYSL